VKLAIAPFDALAFRNVWEEILKLHAGDLNYVPARREVPKARVSKERDRSRVSSEQEPMSDVAVRRHGVGRVRRTCGRKTRFVTSAMQLFVSINLVFLLVPLQVVVIGHR